MSVPWFGGPFVSAECNFACNSRPLPRSRHRIGSVIPGLLPILSSTEHAGFGNRGEVAE